MYKRTLLWGSVAALVIAALALTGCNSSNKSETPAPTGQSVSISAPSEMTAGNTSVVVAVVRTGTTAVADVDVEFSVSPSSAGTFTATSVTTDGNGEAATVFNATNSGTATVTARIVGTTTTASAAMAIQNEPTQQGSGNISVVVTPGLLLANNTDSALVGVTVRDAAGVLAPESTLVRFVAGEKFVDKDGNGYWSSGIDSLVFDADGSGSWNGVGIIPSVGYTVGTTGQVSVWYYSGNTAITAYIRASVNDNGITGYGEVPLQLSPNAQIASIFLASDTMNLSVKGTGGIETGVLRATGYDQNGNPVPEGLPISFLITAGPNGGEHLANTGLGPYQAVTNSQGVAIATISSGTRSGTVRIRAYSDTVFSEATQVLVSAGPPKYIVVGAEKCNVDFWDNVGAFNHVTAVVSDTFLNPVNDSTVVYFSTDEGTMKSHFQRTMDDEGIATTDWISGNNVASANGRVWIYAETHGGAVRDSALFFNTHYSDTLIVSGMPAFLNADGAAKVTVTVCGLDLNSNPVIDGTSFDADATYVAVTSGQMGNGCGSSCDFSTVTSKTLSLDGSTPGGNDDGIGAVDQVVFWSDGSAITRVNLQLRTGNAYSGNSKVIAPDNGNANQPVNIGVSIRDRWNNPLGDHTCTVRQGVTVLGTLETDPYGEGFGVTWTPPDTGKYNITVTDNDPRGGGMVLTKTITVTP